MTTREVVLDGGSPWGFRLHGGADVQQPLRVSRVNPGSKAALRGIREGDLITSINNQSTKDITNAEAHAFLKNSGNTLRLGLNEDSSGSPKRRQYKTIHQETHSETVKKSSTTSYTLTSSLSKKTPENTIGNEEKPSNTVNGTSIEQTPGYISSTCSSTASTPGHASFTMADNVSTSRSRRNKRSRNRRKAKGKSMTPVLESYIVKEPTQKILAKSKSLDDDSVKIEEIIETDVGLSKEEEINLRTFLHSLPLITCPEEAAVKVDSTKMKREEKRAALEQYFAPMLHHPRFLDVISEENSDSSDLKAESKIHLESHIVKCDSQPEIVFLEDSSSGSDSPSEETEITQQSTNTKLTVKKNEIIVLSMEEKNDSLYKTPQCTISEITQLTPPPTPDDKSPKDIELIAPAETNLSSFPTNDNSINLDSSQAAEISSNALTPINPSPSPSLSSGSSRSLSTVKYIPSSSSIDDMTSLNWFNPITLRELCINHLIAQPFGTDILQELADVALSIEHLTSNLLPHNSPTNLIDIPVNQMSWTGLQSDFDPKLLLYLSPTQKSELDKNKKTKDEASNLIDLHTKFIFRTNSSSSNEKKTQNFATLPRCKIDNARLKAKDLSEWLHLAKNNQPTLEAQMLLLQEKERQIQEELEILEEEKRKITAEMAPSKFKIEDYHISKQGDFAENKKSRPISMPGLTSEYFRKQMFEEYMNQIAERQERKQLKVIKVTTPTQQQENKNYHGLEDEFMDIVRQKQKLGKLLIENEETPMESEEVPKHLQEFLEMTEENGDKCLRKCKEARRINRALSKNRKSNNRAGLLHDIDSSLVIAKGFLLRKGIWSPGQKLSFDIPESAPQKIQYSQKDDPISPVWTPKSANSSPIAERKEFKPIKFESPVLGRKQFKNEVEQADEHPWKAPEGSSDTGVILSSTLQKRIPISQSSPGFDNFGPRLPRAQNPTITLLQKAREGQLPKGALYIEDEQTFRRPQNDKPSRVGPGEILYKIKNEYTSESDTEIPRKMADLGPRKFEGIGPTTRDGMPLILRSEVKDANQSKWYKKMYDTIHKQRPHRDEYVTVKYKQRRGQYPYSSGYLSEPEPGAYDSDYTDYKYATLDRRRPRDKENDFVFSTMPKNLDKDVIRHGHDPYRNQPGRIENYIPGKSSVSEKEAKEWWDEVMDIFDGHLEQQKRVPQTRSFINQALKESGYESDSTLVFRRRDENASLLSPSEQKEAYKIIQKGGDVPLHGLRKPAPERPKELEYFPTSSRVRAHKDIKPQKEFLCYPVTVHPHPSTLFAHYKRVAPSAAAMASKPPSPPRRRSSRNNTTLRLISTMKVKTDKSPLCRRHETCFTTTSTVNNANVKFLRDKISCKLAPGKDNKTVKGRPRPMSASPDLGRKVEKPMTRNQTSFRSQSTGTIRKPTKKPSSESIEKTKVFTPPSRTFGQQKHKAELILPRQQATLVNSPDLVSPTEVKKVYKNTSALLASAKNESLPKTKNHTIPIKVGISDKAKSIIRRSPKSPMATITRNKSLSPLPSITKTRPICESPTAPTKKVVVSTVGRQPSKTTTKIVRTPSKKKNKKDESMQLVKVDKSKCAGRAAGTEMVRKLRQMDDHKEFGSTDTLHEIQKQKESIETNYFFQHLFLRDLPSPTPSMSARNSWLLERAFTLQRRRSPEPSISAMKVYLKHTKPVSESKFKCFDLRSRSVSPAKEPPRIIEKRSTSLPPKLVFSQTSRPVCVRVETPPLSPRPIRSPSSRRIQHFRNEIPKPKTELSIYSCPSIAHSTSSIDSCDKKEYQSYVKELLRSSRKSNKFKDLNDFYSSIEKFGQLEQLYNLKPRRKFEDEIIDYDRWQEVRTREKAEKELQNIISKLKENAKEKGFLFTPKEIDNYRWKKELDRGLRIKEKSVDNIKEAFEKLKDEEMRKPELISFKDTYKPLWRGDSVLSLASRMSERRSQSEGRGESVRQKIIDSERMLTHGIGSRLWSSLSSEQVNILKSQLSEIYNQNFLKQRQDYTIEVPSKEKKLPSPILSVRRNSDSVDYQPIKEVEKKVISQNISKEVLEHVTRGNLPLVKAKETRGATTLAKIENLTSETDSGSTDESNRTVIYKPAKQEIKKKVEYFENARDKDNYSPTIYKPADIEEPQDADTSPSFNRHSITSRSNQNLKEFFGEQELMKFASIPLAATRKDPYVSPERPTVLRSSSPAISEATTTDSLFRSRSLSPFSDESLAIVKSGEVRRLRNKFEEDRAKFLTYPPRRSRSDPNLSNLEICYPNHSVEMLKNKYEYPVHVGRGRSRMRRGGVVSPNFLRAEDRFMPHINIISKIASLYAKKNSDGKTLNVDELASILGCPKGEVEKMRKKFDQNISLLGQMFTSSPNIKELRDIAPYLAASWIAHRYPKSDDNTRSLSSPDDSVGSRDVNLLRKDRQRPKSISPSPKPSILKEDTKKQPVRRYQPQPLRYKWIPTHTRPSVSFKEPEPPIPPPKGHHGLRHLQQESPRKYVENEVTIHYKTPVRHEIKEYLSEDELAYRQAEAMKKIYQEERRRKYLQVSKSLQELQDMNNRRHADNFIPSQKSPIPLNRYDDFEADLTPPVKPRPRSPEPRLLARALYNFVGQTARELTFRKGDLIHVRRQVDKNWYEGELNAMVGLFPVNYVEIVTYDTAKTAPRKTHEGQARAKYNFVAQTHLELSLGKGELVIVTRRVDDNWYEGKIGGRKGIFPVSYVEILIDPSDPPPPSTKPVASPAAHSLLLNGSAGGKESMGSHSYTPTFTKNESNSNYFHAKPAHVGNSYGSLQKGRNSMGQTLHIETQSEPIPYRALYKYLPQNDDELELLEGDTVYVLEKCDDGWFVGSSERTGAFGTFPGNYVERI